MVNGSPDQVKRSAKTAESIGDSRSEQHRGQNPSTAEVNSVDNLSAAMVQNQTREGQPKTSTENLPNSMNTLPMSACDFIF
eukprot:5823235-Amphidinium_carterae.1